MQLNVTTDYALRIVLYLSVKKEMANSREIAELMGIPDTYILKITKTLKSAGILAEKRGVGGGFTLKAAPEELTVLTVIDAMEKTVRINRCLEDDRFCSRHAAPYCKIRKYYQKIQDEMEQKLSIGISEFI